MSNAARLAAVTFASLFVAASPALAEDGPVTHTDQLVVVTPNPPVVIHNGGAPGAAPAPAPAPVAVAVAATTTAPQNERWEDVSHINGTLVKVGEKGDYLLRYRKTNISTNPIGWMFGFYGVSVSHAIHPNVAIRADANIIAFENTDGYEIGASLPIYFKKVYSGPFVEPGIITRGTRHESYCDASYYGGGCMDTTDTMVGPSVLFGWHWTFDSGLNVAAAFGAARNLANQTDAYGYSGDAVEPAGYFRIGYAF